jgi:hypothetical protein
MTQLTPNPTRVLSSLIAIDRWFESIRTPQGIGGPISHWWESSLLYCAPMIDWRYEGILSGYVELYRKTNQASWLERAVVAGNEVCAGQLDNGCFWNSSFQIGPIEGGTPHESAVDVGLLELARLLHELNDSRWQTYFKAAERNLREFQIGQLWNDQKRAFRDQPWNSTYVPNKNGTIMEALLLYEALSGESMEQYILGATELMLSAQVHGTVPYQGATVHLGTGQHRLMIGIYTARNVSALIRLYSRYPSQRFLDAALAMGKFLETLLRSNGTAFGYYPDGRMILCPTWVSPSGDFLRAFLSLQPFAAGQDVLAEQIAISLVSQQLPSGGIPTSHGLGNKGGVKAPPRLPDFRDVLPVAGWIDKAFRGLALFLPAGFNDQGLSSAPSAPTNVACTWKGASCIYLETEDELSLIRNRGNRLLYRWQKGLPYPNVYRL